MTPPLRSWFWNKGPDTPAPDGPPDEEWDACEQWEREQDRLAEEF